MLRSCLVLAFALVASDAVAQTLCNAELGTSGGTVVHASGFALRTRVAPAISGSSVDESGAAVRGGLAPVPCSVISTSVDPITPSVRRTGLTAVAPNPFNPRTTVHFDLARRGPVRVDVYDAAGRRVTTLLDATLDAGAHERSFDARELGSGVYHVRLRAGDVVSARPVVLVK